MNTHSIEYISPLALKPRVRAWRKYPKEQIETACRLLSDGGQVVEPPLVDSDNCVVCGGAIVLAAQKLGLETIPILRVSSMSPEELRLYAINAHKLADMGSYDDLLLGEELRELEILLGEDALKVLAITEGELTRLLALDQPMVEKQPLPKTDEDYEPVTRPGDLWKIGPHRLLCGNSLFASSYKTLMAGELAQFGFTDMPYNLPARDISSNPDREDFAFAYGEMSPNEFTRFQTTFMRHMKEWSEPGSLHAFFMSYHFLPETFRAGMIVFGRAKAMCTWIKSQPGQGGLFRSQTEQIVYFKNGDAPSRNNVNLGKHGRNRSTAWHYDGMTTASSERDELLKLHATPKNVLLLKDAILDVTSRGGIVLDPFAGIGSIFLAAQSAERRAYGIEIEPKFVDATLRRMRSAFGIDPIREADGASFSELEAACDLEVQS
ncbi:MAG: DNA modification methylase [Candidatus Andeanibacterium colombiense]|uniref:Methyltransferase n=1 Tax=Candidatus Andeanibacterium colombiense TaxID=3121345 RepID=A0AAJ5X597_9SPHN|nr:MAG: DNA modification methylase [Sphingomonadaceae bacterium]